RLVTVVVINDPRGGAYFGGAVAAPVYAKVTADALRLLRVPPDAAPDEQVAGQDFRAATASTTGDRLRWQPAPPTSPRSSPTCCRASASRGTLSSRVCASTAVAAARGMPSSPCPVAATMAATTSPRPSPGA